MDVGTVLVVAEAPEEFPARAVEGDPRVVDEVWVDAMARTASTALAFHDVRADSLAMNRIVAKLHRLIRRRHGRSQRGERKRWHPALKVLVGLPEKERPVASVCALHGVPEDHAGRLLNPNKMVFRHSHGSSCELLVPFQKPIIPAQTPNSMGRNTWGE